MKTKLILSVLLCTGLICHSQITLNVSSHSLNVDENNHMTICSYSNPGLSGKNVTWNFKNLEPVTELHAELEDYSNVYDKYGFSESNTILNEFGNRFLFYIDNDEILQTGFVSSNGKTFVKYNGPLVKMKYPLSYDEGYSGHFTGEYHSGNINGAIEGTYEIIADGYGTLELPNNIVYENTLRVKTIKSYDRMIGKNRQDIEITSYRWYNEYHRYPLLVFTSYAVSGTNNNVATNFQAAYNTDVIVPPENQISSEDFSWNVYPNPTSNYVYIELNIPQPTDLELKLYDINGQFITSVKKLNNVAGYYYSGFYPAEYNLQHGVYFLKVETGSSAFTKELIYTEK